MTPNDSVESDRWRRICDLFDRVVESGDEGLLAAETDEEVRRGAVELVRSHNLADEEEFLDESFTAIREISATKLDEARFSSGEVLTNRFEILRLLGVGGMGEVYLADDRRLGTRVALKTIRRILAEEPRVRQRFMAEVKNAQRVTHPNVCRIYDLFEHDGIAFFSMEFLEGEQLDAVLARADSEKAVRNRIALQLAEGLHSAHERGVIHRDFKPQNVIVQVSVDSLRAVITDFGLARAAQAAADSSRHELAAVSIPGEQITLEGGTAEYMAPELKDGKPATIQSDIYAFGRVLSKIDPDSELARWCSASSPGERPPTMEPVVRALRGKRPNRRKIILGLAGVAATGGAIGYGWRSATARTSERAARQRLILNGFRAPDEHADRSSILRFLIQSGLRQSPLISLVPDNQVLSSLRSLNIRPQLPADRPALLALARGEHAALLLDGIIEAGQRGLQLVLHLLERGEVLTTITRSFTPDDHPNSIAEPVIAQVRLELGESAGAVALSRPLADITTASPEAVDYFLKAVNRLERTDADGAIALLDQAIQLDRSFALAHHYRALAFSATYRTVSGLEASRMAYSLRDRVSERERNWIDWLYWLLCGDHLASLQTVRKNTILFPDEAIFHRQTAGAHAKLRQFSDAIPYNVRSVELDSFSDNNRAELVANLAESGQGETALAALARFRTEGHTSPMQELGACYAYVATGELDKATDAVDRYAQNADHERSARLFRSKLQILQGKFVEAAAGLEADLAYDRVAKEEQRMAHRLDLLGRVRWLMGDASRAAEHAEALCGFPVEPSNIQFFREGAMLSLELGKPDPAERGLKALIEIERKWPSTHSSGARFHIDGEIAAFLGNPDAARFLSQASGLWPDPITLFSLGRHLEKLGRWEAAGKCFVQVLTLKGTLFKRHFAGFYVLAMFHQARCLKNLSQFSESLRLFDRVLSQWAPASAFPILDAVRAERETVRTQVKG